MILVGVSSEAVASLAASLPLLLRHKRPKVWKIVKLVSIQLNSSYVTAIWQRPLIFLSQLHTSLPLLLRHTAQSLEKIVDSV